MSRPPTMPDHVFYGNILQYHYTEFSVDRSSNGCYFLTHIEYENTEFTSVFSEWSEKKEIIYNLLAWVLLCGRISYCSILRISIMRTQI